jgi:hypothetical protein
VKARKVEKQTASYPNPSREKAVVDFKLQISVPRHSVEIKHFHLLHPVLLAISLRQIATVPRPMLKRELPDTKVACMVLGAV